MMSSSIQSPDTVDLFSRNLGRGKACSLCRKRKLRCDGVQPVCGRCMEARNRRLNRMRLKGMDEARINAIVFPPCFTEVEEVGETSKERPLQQAFGMDAAEGSKSSKQRRIDKTSKENGNHNDLFFAEILSSHLPMDVGSSSRNTQESSTNQFSSPAETVSSMGGRRVPSLLSGSAIAILPSAEEITKLTKVFLEAYSMYAIIQPQRLLERIAKGSDHEDYPHSSLIHIIVALAYAERPDLDSTLAEGPAHARVGAHYRHTLAAQQAVFESMHLGASRIWFFDVARAILLLCCKQYGFGDLFESFMSNSAAMRACIGLNLNKEAFNTSMVEQELIHPTLLPRITDGSIMQIKPKDAVEAEEVRRTMLAAFACDRTCCATTLWPGTLSEEDYATSLPRTTLKEFLEGTFTNEVMNRPARYLNNPDFYTGQSLDADQMMLKGSVLLGQCAQLISRLPRNATKEFISAMPSYQRLESYITSLQLNNTALAASTTGISSNRSSVAALSIWLTTNHSLHLYDGILISSTCIPFACTLTLHEPFANLSEESEAACRGASRSIIAIIRTCSSNAESESMRLHVVLIFIIGLVGRSLIRQLESLYSKLIAHEFTATTTSSSQQNNVNIDQDNKDFVGNLGEGISSVANSVWDSKEFTDSVSLLQADLEVVLLTLKRIGYKWPIAMKQHETLLKLLQFNPEHRLRGLFCVE